MRIRFGLLLVALSYCRSSLLLFTPQSIWQGQVLFLHLPRALAPLSRARIKVPSSLSFYFSFSLTERTTIVIQPYCCNWKDFKMASEWTFSDQVALATLVFAILAVLLFCRTFLWPLASFRTLPSFAESILRTMTFWQNSASKIASLRQSARTSKSCAKIPTSSLTGSKLRPTPSSQSIGEKLKEKMD